MKKFFFCVSLVLTGLMTSCVDKYEEVDAESRPSWLGSSIYAELKNPGSNSKLKGTFNTYLKLVDELGYKEVLNQTGSKTVFPANDEAFDRFFGKDDGIPDNIWGVKDYSELSIAKKKLLLYSSMLDNALLLGMLPNVSNGTAEPSKGQALKHETSIHITDSIQHIVSKDSMPQNNPYWARYYNNGNKGIYVVRDSTLPMMVHITREYMLQNGITTQGDESDFAILTGTPYTEGTAYIFNDKVISGDVTCQNGYIHQMENVVTPPGNMAEVLHRKPETKIFSHILDYFSVPVYSASITKNYNDWAMVNNQPQIDSIFQVCYFSSRSNRSLGKNDVPRISDPVTGKGVETYLAFDPGWNQYHPSSLSDDARIIDVAAAFVPDDNAFKQYFLPGGQGAYLIDIYGKKPNTEENLFENLDSFFVQRPKILTDFVKNLMKPSFALSVPSKFSTVQNDVQEVMELSTGLIKENSDGKKDITFANNGVIYLMDEVIAPDEYRSVMAPSNVYKDMKVMNWAVSDHQYLDLDYSYYLTAMQANYGFFIPQDEAFQGAGCFYLEPTSLAHTDASGMPLPATVLQFYYDPSVSSVLMCNRYNFNRETGEIYGNPTSVSVNEFKKPLAEILNFHTVVLNQGEAIGDRHFYQTKLGGTIYVEAKGEGKRVTSGEQYEENPIFPAPVIKTVFDDLKNGTAYRLNHVIQPPIQSVFAALNQNAKLTADRTVNEKSSFSEFLNLCENIKDEDVLEWVGVKKAPDQKGLPSPQDAYTIFTNEKDTTDQCLDMNVKMFNTYHYTLFAPDNTAMQKAYAKGLPKWSDIVALYDKYHSDDDSTPVGGNEAQDIKTAKSMINTIRDFLRYHFMVRSVYADDVLAAKGYETYKTLSTDNLGLARELKVAIGGGKIEIQDNGKVGEGGNKAPHTISVNVSDKSAGKMINKMTRDIWFDLPKSDAKSIYTSSFCAVHQISEPLYFREDLSAQ